MIKLYDPDTCPCKNFDCPGIRTVNPASSSITIPTATL